MLLYALLHLSGYDLPMDELKRFRQLHSKTPGHPEYGMTPGVETTTGPLGQGITNAVGMALAERLLAAEFNRPGFAVVDHYTYVFLGDGCLMEGISHEACSLAGTLGLSRLIAFYDDNGISIDGHVEGWFADDTPARFEAYGWHVERAIDGHDPAAIEAALERARAQTTKPALICCKTVIGWGSPNKAGTHDSHGSALGEAEVAATRAALGWTSPAFEIPQDIYDAWDGRARGAELEAQWNALMASYRAAHPTLAAEFDRRVHGELPAAWTEHVRALIAKTNETAETIATRKASQNAIEGLAPVLPELLGGSADLAGSNLTLWSGARGIGHGNLAGNYVYYGVREFGMSAMMNGTALHGGLIPYGATFVTFSDYARNALRMAALMKLRVLFVYTHDSIGLGEDGPTHQPIEHAATLRLIPNLDVWRPCDTLESLTAWVAGIERRDGPTCMLFSRQNLPFQKRDAATVENIRRGGYVLADADGTPAAILIATGSEVALAMAAREALRAKGIQVRVVSMPSTNVFDRQDAAYRASVLLPGVVRIAVEAGSTGGWYKYVGLDGAVVGIDRFGESAPAGELFKYFGLTADHVTATVERTIAAAR